ncbi:MAG: 50S ribosomal protein L17 [Flavobacteriales bacterium]|nr:50S ribosomal protein L17 [Flavobacteriales bacterium]
MRHGKKFNHLGRQAPHRKAMLANMACSLIEHKRVNTTVAKAKALKKFVEPLITKSKTDSTHSRRTCFRYLRSKEAVTELFREVSVKVADRPGGYTRILKTGFRQGDNAEMCFIELVDYNENMLKDSKKKTSSRRRRGGAKKDDTVATTPVEETVEATEADTKAEVVEDAPTEEAPAAGVVEDVVEEAKVEEVKTEATEDAPAEEAAPEAKAEAAPEEKKDAPNEEADNSDEEEKKEE